MTREDIIQMAHDAGFEEFILDEVDGVPIYRLCESEVVFERFAKMVAAAEREACAVVCDKLGDEYGDANAADCAAAIRARGRDEFL